MTPNKGLNPKGSTMTVKESTLKGKGGKNEDKMLGGDTVNDAHILS